MYRRWQMFLTLGVLIVTSSCSLFEMGCDTLGRPAVTVGVTDAQTGADALAGATVTVTDGHFIETHVVPDDPSRTGRLGAAIGRSGTYAVAVTKVGYQPWTRDGIVVTQNDGCHVRTVNVDAALSGQ